MVACAALYGGMHTIHGYHISMVERPASEEQESPVSDEEPTQEDLDWLDRQVVEKAEILQWLADH